MKKLLRTLGIVGVLGGTVALAGPKYGYPVQVNLTSRHASGGFGTARNSADSVQYIGCDVYGYTTSVPRVSCYARSAAGTYASCSSTDPNLLAVARSISDDSIVSFNWDASGTCTYLFAGNASMAEPREP